MGKLGQPGRSTQWNTGPHSAASYGERAGKADGQKSGCQKDGLSSVSPEDRDIPTKINTYHIRATSHSGFEHFGV